jgi:hypothetical protein
MQENNDHIELFKVIEEQLLSALVYFDDGRIWLARERIETLLEDVFSVDLRKY